MATVTLIQNAQSDATHIIQMTAMPMNVNLTGLAGGPAQFSCTNALATIANASTVDITFDATINPPHQEVQVSSVQA